LGIGQRSPRSLLLPLRSVEPDPAKFRFTAGVVYKSHQRE